MTETGYELPQVLSDPHKALGRIGFVQNGSAGLLDPLRIAFDLLGDRQARSALFEGGERNVTDAGICQR